MNKHWSYEGTYIECIRYIYNAKFEPMPALIFSRRRIDI